jgi:hypothetical protein
MGGEVIIFHAPMHISSVILYTEQTGRHEYDFTAHATRARAEGWLRPPAALPEGVFLRRPRARRRGAEAGGVGGAGADDGQPQQRA